MYPYSRVRWTTVESSDLLELFLAVPGGDNEGAATVEAIVKGGHTQVCTFYLFKRHLDHSLWVKLWEE